jgi:phenylpropionate dioxygenase-like ring-hydroxylating dioxygenase large terminal subunit
MLSREDTELLTRIGPGTPMGALMREYWWPVLRNETVEADGAPTRVRLLGQDFVLFRATDGRLAMFDEGCPHRGASLVLARNEDCALRCLLHGWQISVDGKIIETPNEKNFRHADRIDVRAYPAREAGGMVWVWIGDGEPPSFPAFDFNTVADPEAQVLPAGMYLNCNWLQALETLWDPAHQACLHNQDNAVALAFEKSEDALFKRQHPELTISNIETVSEPWGFRRHCDGGPRLNGDGWVPTVMPTWHFTGGLGPNVDEDDRVVFGHVPIDDEHMLLWQIAYNPYRPLGEIGRTLCGRMPNADDFRVPGASRENNWGQDREIMSNGSWSGIGVGYGVAGILTQDAAIVEGMGAIADRTNEHLGAADLSIIRGRRMMLDAVRAHMRGEGALGVDVDVAGIGLGHDGTSKVGTPDLVS